MALFRWLTVALATLATTGALHAQTASFSVLGLTSVFGQEIPARPALNLLPWNALSANYVLGWTLQLPDFEEIQEPTDTGELPPAQSGSHSLSNLITQCMRCWKDQWSQGNFRQAEMLASTACKLDPTNVTCRHALVLSQVMQGFVESLSANPTCVSGLTPAGALTSDLGIALSDFRGSVSSGCLSCDSIKLVSAEKTCAQCTKANSCCQVTASAAKTSASAAKPDCCCVKAAQAKPECCCVKAAQTVQAKPDCCCVKTAQTKPDCCCVKAAQAKTTASCCQDGGTCETGNQKTQGEVAEQIKQLRLLVREGKYKEALAVARKMKELDPDNLAADAAIQIMSIRNPEREYKEVAKGGCGSACCPKSALAKKAQSVFLPPMPCTVVGASSDNNAPCPFLEGLRVIMTAPAQRAPIVSGVAYPPMVLPNPMNMLPGFPGVPMPAPQAGGPGLPTPEQVMRDLEMVRNAAMQKARWQTGAMQGQPVAKHNVHLVIANNMEAHCERLSGSAGSNHIILEGDVHLTCERHGQIMHIQGDRVGVNLSNGSFEVESLPTLAIPTGMRVPAPWSPPQPVSYTPSAPRNLVPLAPSAPPPPHDGGYAYPVDD